MNIGHWNRVAHKSNQICDEYNRQLSSKTKFLNGDTYICPRCNKAHSISDSKIIKIIVGKDLVDTLYSGSTAHKTFVKTYCNVRFCRDCYYKNERNKRIFFLVGKFAYFAIGFLLLYWMITTDEKLGFVSWIGAIAGYVILALCALGAKDSVEEYLFDSYNINLEEAFQNNAILSHPHR